MSYFGHVQNYLSIEGNLKILQAAVKGKVIATMVEGINPITKKAETAVHGCWVSMAARLVVIGLISSTINAIVRFLGL